MPNLKVNLRDSSGAIQLGWGMAHPKRFEVGRVIEGWPRRIFVVFPSYPNQTEAPARETATTHKCCPDSFMFDDFCPNTGKPHDMRCKKCEQNVTVCFSFAAKPGKNIEGDKTAC